MAECLITLPLPLAYTLGLCKMLHYWPSLVSALILSDRCLALHPLLFTDLPLCMQLVPFSHVLWFAGQDLEDGHWDNNVRNISLFAFPLFFNVLNYDFSYLWIVISFDKLALFLDVGLSWFSVCQLLWIYCVLPCIMHQWCCLRDLNEVTWVTTISLLNCSILGIKVHDFYMKN